MTHTVRIDTNIPEDRRVALTLPDEVPVGEAEVIVVIVPKHEAVKSGAPELLNSEIFGMWKDLPDDVNGVEWATEIRKSAWKRAAAR